MHRALALCSLTVLLNASCLLAATYEVGEGKTYTSIGAVPWATLAAGDTVLIHYRSTPYKEKWVICRQGTETNPITVRGVAGPGGELPIIDGNGAVVAAGLNYTNEDRGLIKIGSANTPPDTMPMWIVVENLDLRSARPPYQFTGDDSNTHTYRDNAASVYIEKGQNITIRNCQIHDSGNGIFCGMYNGETQNITIEQCYIYDNGIEGSNLQHNTYTSAVGITYRYNRFGPLRTNCDGNNLKDRSSGMTVSYNWIEGGNRQLDLVDASGAPDAVINNALYNATYVYGNVLIEPDGAGNSQVVHYGGDGGDTAKYRKGTLYFVNNTVISTRSGNTTLMRLSTNDESSDCRNNILYVTDEGYRMALTNAAGTINYRNNWYKPGLVDSHGTVTGSVNNQGGNVEGTSPGFLDESGQDYHLAEDSPCIDKGTDTAGLNILNQYGKHQQSETRTPDGTTDIGAYEYAAAPDPNPDPDRAIRRRSSHPDRRSRPIRQPWDDRRTLPSPPPMPMATR